MANASAVFAGRSMSGVFDAKYAEAFGMAGTQPAFATADTLVAHVAVGSDIVVTCESLGLRSVPYTVIERRPDHGLTRLFLERAA